MAAPSWRSARARSTPRSAIPVKPTDIQTRAARLDEGIDLIYGLWAGKLRFEGKHFNVDLEARRDDIARNLQPVQSRIPIWVVALWPRPRTLRRALRCDGLLPNADGRKRLARAHARRYSVDSAVARRQRRRATRLRHHLRRRNARGRSRGRRGQGGAVGRSGQYVVARDRAGRFHRTRMPTAVVRERISAGPPKP